MKHSQKLRQCAAQISAFAGKHPCLLMLLLCLGCILLYPRTQDAAELPWLLTAQSWVLLALPILALMGVFLIYKGKTSDRRTAFLLCAMGFCMRLA